MKLSPVLLAPLILTACAGRTADGVPPSADYVELDLLRPYPGADKIYIEVDLPGGERGVFLVDTGASTSLLSEDIAERLGVVGRDTGGVLAGLGGQLPLSEGRLPWLSLGGVVISDLAVAVGPLSLPPFSGQVPLDGILGNNLWGQLQIAIDYPADVLEVALPGQLAVPADAERMSFDGQHLLVPVTLNAGTEEGPQITKELLLGLDTGSRGIILTDYTGPGFEAVATEGEEPILGVGAAEKIPISTFYQKTRRVPLLSVDIGGVNIPDPGSAIWLSGEERRALGGLDMLGLIGHTVLRGHRLILDYAGGRFALVESQRPPRELDGHRVLLEHDIERHGRSDAERGLYRARLYAALDEPEGAIESLDGYLRRHPGDGEAAVFRARLLRYVGDDEGYWSAVSAVEPRALDEGGELLAAANWALLTGRDREAEDMVDAAVAATPESPQAWLARSDVRYASGDFAGAGAALAEAARLVEDPDTQLLRRARLALAEGDRYGALAHLRRELTLYPTDGPALWFYGLTATAGLPPGRAELLVETLRHDLDQTWDRLHPENRPLDFMMAVAHLLGDEDRTGELLALGLERDCEAQEEAPSRQNCTAWYYALAGRQLDEAAALIEAAVAAEPMRADFLDTLAVVHLARGEIQAAVEAAERAARRAPGDIYNLWQAERIRAAADGSGGARGAPQ